MAASQSPSVCSRTVVMATFMFSVQFSESKIRKTSMPCSAERFTNSFTRLSG